jgi:ribosomal protein S24E
MEVRIINKKENKVMSRTELRFNVVYVGIPPKRLEVRDELAKQLSADPKTVVVQRVQNVFGISKSVGSANVYTTPEAALKYELQYKLIRMGLATKKEKKIEAPKAAAKK